jgi:hypothetical protein
MAGSLNHIVDPDTGRFKRSTVRGYRDAVEALQECYEIIRVLTDGDMEAVNHVCRDLKFPEIRHDMTGLVTPESSPAQETGGD